MKQLNKVKGKRKVMSMSERIAKGQRDHRNKHEQAMLDATAKEINNK